jgi:PncC family amidohydrolase
MKPETLKIVQKVHDLFAKKRLTLSLAESCTGGMISHLVTTLPGASTFFTAGIVSYSELAKKDILGVSDNVISENGVVSGETAKEMARRVRLLSQTDYSVSTTGNLGPDVLEGKDRGLVYVAACSAERTISGELHLNGSREENKEEAAASALRLLVELLES